MSQEDFADFHVEARVSRRLWQWCRRRIVLLSDGKEIFVPCHRNSLLPVLEWGLNACLFGGVHQFLLIHSAVLERDGRAIVLAAHSGSGKSTLCAALAFRGWRLLSDELAVIDPSNGHLLPLCRPICLKNESIRVIHHFAPDAEIGPVCSGTQKGDVAHVRPRREWVDRMQESAKPAWIVLPQYRPDATCRANPLRKGSALARLAQHSLNHAVLGANGFQALADLVEQSDCYELEFGDLDDAVSALEAIAVDASSLTAVPSHA
jgi:HprK-related kinase A